MAGHLNLTIGEEIKDKDEEQLSLHRSLVNNDKMLHLSFQLCGQTIKHKITTRNNNKKTPATEVTGVFLKSVLPESNAGRRYDVTKRQRH